MARQKAIRMKYSLLAIGIIFAFQRTSAGELSSAVELLCKTKNITSDLVPDSSAYARIKEIQELGSVVKDDEAISCVLKDSNDVKIGSALLEIVVEEDPPATLSLEVANLFLPELQSLTLECSYGDIGPNNRIIDNLPIELEPIGEDWSYYCGEAEHALKLLFTGVYQKKSTTPGERENSLGVYQKKSTTPGEREKRFLIDASFKACVTFSKKGSGYHPPKEDEGHYCKIAKKKPGRLMYNEAGSFSCYSCCMQHHWSTAKHELQCKKCSEGTDRKNDNVWTSCNPIAHKGPSETSIFEPKQEATTLPSSNGVDVPESSSTSTQAQSTVEEIKQPPKDPPTELLMVEVSTSYAYIKWEKIPQTPTRPVTGYWISLVKLEPKVETFETECNVTNFNFTFLGPNSTYIVTIQGMNSEGKGPFSSNLTIRTLFELPLVEITDVWGVEGQAHVTWEQKSSDLQLRVVAVPTSPKGEKLSTVQEFDDAGKLTLTLSEEGTYSIRFYYMDTFREGPMSDDYLVHGHPVMDTDTHNWNTGAIVAVTCGIFLVICILIIGFMCYRSRRSAVSSGESSDSKDAQQQLLK